MWHWLSTLGLRPLNTLRSLIRKDNGRQPLAAALTRSRPLIRPPGWPIYVARSPSAPFCAHFACNARECSFRPGNKLIDSIRPDLGLRPILRIVYVAPSPRGSIRSLPNTRTLWARLRRVYPAGPRTAVFQGLFLCAHELISCRAKSISLSSLVASPFKKERGPLPTPRRASLPSPCPRHKESHVVQR